MGHLINGPCYLLEEERTHQRYKHIQGKDTQKKLWQFKEQLHLRLRRITETLGQANKVSSWFLQSDFCHNLASDF